MERSRVWLWVMGGTLHLLIIAHVAAVVALCSSPQPGVRINKAFTARFSRRESDRIVASGRVCINGRVANPGDRVKPGDHVTLDGEQFDAVFDGYSEAAKENHVYIKFWKPRGVTCTTDTGIKGNIIDALGHTGNERLFTVGRLDKDSEGLILLTNDGRVPNSINRADHAKEKIYDVVCSRSLSDSHIRQLARGVVITTTAQRDRGPPKTLTAPTRPCKVERMGSKAFRIVLTEGRNRQIRRMCQALGFTVVRLHRLEIMGIGLDGLDGPGDWCDLTGSDKNVVLDAIAQAAHKPVQPSVARPPSADLRRPTVVGADASGSPAGRRNQFSAQGRRGRGRGLGRGRGASASGSSGHGVGRGRGATASAISRGRGRRRGVARGVNIRNREW